MIIYCITNLINNKKYIGQTTKTLEERFNNHSRKNTIIGKVIRKYGVKNFIIERIDSAQNQEELNLKEILWIEYLAGHISTGQGYNVAYGGTGTGKHSETTKQKISNSLKGKAGTPHTKESKQKISYANKGRLLTCEHKQSISKSNKGRPSPNKGKVASLTTREKQSKSHQGKVLSAEHRLNISKSSKGKILSEESKEKMRKPKISTHGLNVSKGRIGVKQKNNTSGYINVVWHQATKTWMYQITVNKQHYGQAGFESPEMANQALQILKKLLLQNY